VSHLERAREYWERIDARPGPGDTVNLTATVGALLNAVEEQTEARQNLRELMAMRPVPTSSVGVSRLDALKAAREHVEAMATNSRGYPEGSLADRVTAVDRFARFLMGESE
jgi:hypothetical protein